MPAKGAWRVLGRLCQTAAPLRHSTTEGSVCPQIPIAAPSPLATKNVQLSIECLAPWHLALRSCGDRVCLSLQSVVCQETGVARKPGRASHKPLKPKRRNNHVQHHASHEQRCNATTLTDLRHGAFCARAGRVSASPQLGFAWPNTGPLPIGKLGRPLGTGIKNCRHLHIVIS